MKNIMSLEIGLEKRIMRIMGNDYFTVPYSETWDWMGGFCTYGFERGVLLIFENGEEILVPADLKRGYADSRIEDWESDEGRSWKEVLKEEIENGGELKEIVFWIWRRWSEDREFFKVYKFNKWGGFVGFYCVEPDGTGWVDEVKAERMGGYKMEWGEVMDLLRMY